MNAWETFVHMFDALDVRYDDMPSQELGNYLSSLNPFLFADMGSADPAEFADFEHDFASTFPNGQATPQEAYAFCLARIKRTAGPVVQEAFMQTSEYGWCYAWEHKDD